MLDSGTENLLIKNIQEYVKDKSRVGFTLSFPIYLKKVNPAYMKEVYENS
jgi:hexokinase